MAKLSVEVEGERHEALKEWAKREKRSIRGQLEQIVEEAIDRELGVKPKACCGGHTSME